MIQFGILGIGVDIEDIERFRSPELNTDKVLLEKIFTVAELCHCRDYVDPAPHLAVRYAAKEAIVKALAEAGIVVNEFYKIEILNDKSDIPQVVVHGKNINGMQIHISLSHNRENAIAFAIVTK